ncbi:MAG: PIN domain-containing protein [Chloroflexota bacterium]
MALLIDTSSSITVERRGVPLAEAFRELQGEELALSAITVSELLVGVHRAGSGRRQVERAAFVEDIIDKLPVLSIDREVARIHAHIGAELASVGIAIGAHDLLIGATAIAHNATIVTENLRDFERIRGLRVFRPEW